ncbi:flagellar biosynthetic protein FliO [Desulfurivibrio alkaliphilus]|nr:flagellar biosynthetic protein FliO [Desulfurivibrio alkaliphilus]
MAPKAEQEATVADQPQKLPAAATANDQPQPVADDPWAADYYQHQEGEVFSPTMSLLKAFGVLLLMIGLMLFVAALLKRLGFGQGGFRGQGELIRVIETRSVGPKKYLAVVEVGGEFLLLGIGDQQINLLTRLENDELIRQSQATGAGGPGSSGPGGFAGLLAGALKQRRERKD